MFGFGKGNTETNEELKQKIEDLREVIKDYKAESKAQDLNHGLAIKEMKHAHNLELLSKQFEIEHKTDQDKDTLRKNVERLEKELGVMTKERDMLKEIVDINADIIDIKELVKTLIQKIPTIDIKSLNVTSSDSGSRSSDKK